MILHLGVVDAAYAEDGETTGEVAQYLEDKFGVMQTFFDMNSGYIADRIENSLAGSIETLVMKGSPQEDIFASGMSDVEHRFREYITMQEHGIQLKSEAQGSRFKMQYKKVKAKKIAFVDTGLYRRSFKAWVDG